MSMNHKIIKARDVSKKSIKKGLVLNLSGLGQSIGVRDTSWHNTMEPSWQAFSHFSLAIKFTDVTGPVTCARYLVEYVDYTTIIRTMPPLMPIPNRIDNTKQVIQ